jgi:hypothetical protein
MKVQIALNYLKILIEEGIEFPQAFDKAGSRFKLSPAEKLELKQLYDLAS